MIYPRTYSPAGIVASMLSVLMNLGLTTPVVIMSQDPAQVKALLGVELPPELFIPYGESVTLNTALESNALIIVDSVSMFRVLRIGQYAARKGQSCRFLVLGTLGLDAIDLDYLNEHLPGIYLLYAAFADPKIGLNFRLEVVVMTPEQTRLYENRRREEERLLRSGTAKEKHEAKLALHSKQIANFVYPVDIQRVLDLPREQRAPVADDKPAIQGGWVSQQDLNDLARNPKMQRLLATLVGQRNKAGSRQIVYSRFLNRYGLELVSALLNVLGIENTILSGKDSRVTQREAKINQFNQLPQGILLTNLLNLPINPVMISDLHFLEGYEMNVLEGFLNSLYRAGQYPAEGGNLTIHSYIAQKNDQTDAIDATSYRIVTEQFINHVQLYDRLVMAGVPVIYNATNGELELLVVTPTTTVAIPQPTTPQPTTPQAAIPIGITPAVPNTNQQITQEPNQPVQQENPEGVTFAQTVDDLEEEEGDDLEEEEGDGMDELINGDDLEEGEYDEEGEEGEEGDEEGEVFIEGREPFDENDGYNQEDGYDDYDFDV